jgi:sterol desaturase/sphingolipid hydroxylase (fatty acid hydroxylase superfamily)
MLTIGGWATTFVALGLAFALVRRVEARLCVEDPTTAHAQGELRREALFAVAYVVTAISLAPLSLWACHAGLAALGGHPVVYVQGTGWAARLALTLVYFVMIDLMDYAWHRACHAVPCLWAVHSFHHSATHLNLLTTAREHWTAAVVALPVRLAIGLLIGIDPATALVATWLWSIPPRLSHMNLRHARGDTWLLVTPQWHRIHHSSLPEHQGKNFGVVLPIFDRLFGTAHVPAPDEYPPTGLATSEQASLWDALVWPFRAPVSAVVSRRRHDAPAQRV